MPAGKDVPPSVWLRQPRERQAPALSRERIVSEALRLLDAEGIDALNMRRLGSSLGVAATSLYRHVANKDELIELVVDAVYGEVEVTVPDGPAGWRAAATAVAGQLRALILRHPWIVSTLGDMGLFHLGPNVMRFSDDMLALFRVAGFALEEADQATAALAGYVVGMATAEAAWLTKFARAGQEERDLADRLRPVLEDAIQDYPMLRELYTAQGAHADPAAIRTAKFDFGVERILDGLAVHLDRDQ